MPINSETYKQLLDFESIVNGSIFRLTLSMDDKFILQLKNKTLFTYMSAPFNTMEEAIAFIEGFNRSDHIKAIMDKK